MQYVPDMIIVVAAVKGVCRARVDVSRHDTPGDPVFVSSDCQLTTDQGDFQIGYLVTVHSQQNQFNWPNATVYVS